MHRHALPVSLLVTALAALFVTPGCATGASIEERGGPPASRPPDDPDLPTAWALEVDTRETPSYFAPDVGLARLSGTVVASEGLSRLVVAGVEVPVVGGRFAADVAAAPGLVHVPIEASDDARHTRRADRSLLVATFLEEGDLDPRAASLALTNEIVEPMAAPLQARVATIDIASEIRARPTLTDDSCVTRPTGAHHGTPRLRTFVDATGQLVLEITIPSLEVSFVGRCDTFLTSTDVTGRMRTHVVLRTVLSAPPGEECVAGLAHSPAQIDLVDFDLDVRGGSGLFGLLVSLAGEMREGDTAEALRAQFAAEADALLDAELGMVRVFDESATREFFGVPVDLALCLTGLVTEDGALRAIVGSRATGPGGRDAPGAPMVDGALPAMVPGALTLDANLVAQLVYSAWRAGALAQPDVLEVPMSMLSLVAPRLRTMFPADTTVSVDLEGELPPLVRAASLDGDAGGDGSGGDLALEIGDLFLVLRVGETVLFRVGNVLRFTLELVPEAGGALRPEVVSVESETWVAEEPVADAIDAALAGAISAQIGDAAAALLGGAAIELPAIGGAPLVASDVTPDPAGRYVHVLLAP